MEIDCAKLQLLDKKDLRKTDNFLSGIINNKTFQNI